MINEAFYTNDRKGNLTPMTEDLKAQMMLKMFLTLSSINENSVGNEINKYFIQIIPENSSDLLTILSSLSKQIPKDFQLKKEGVYTIIHNIISKNFCRDNMLVFNQYNINDIGKILSYIFSLDLKNMKIKSYEILQNKIALFFANNKNIINEYEVYRRNMSYNPKAKTNIYEMFKESKQNKKELNIPIELAFIVQKLSMITKLILQFETIPEPLFNLAIIILLNYKLLFPNIVLIEVDMRNYGLVKEIFKRHQNQLVKNTEEQIKQINLDNEEYNKRNFTLQSIHIDIQDDINKKDNLFDLNKVNTYESTNDFSDPEDKVDKCNVTILSKEDEKLINYTDILSKHKRLFELGIIFPYFISHWNDLQSINIIFPYNFGRETEDALSLNYKVILMNYHFLNFIYPICKLKQLTLEFNALDSDTFEKIISLINLNSQLESLTLSFFGIELFYLPSSLFQLINKLKINVNHLLNQGSETALKNYDTEEFSQLLIEFFLNNFEENIEKLFWLIKGEAHITNINLFFATPPIISNHEGYMTIITKFILNCLLLISSPKSKYNLFKIIAPYVYLDNRKTNEMTQIVDKINYKLNSLHLTSLTIQLQCFNMVSLGNMLGYNLIELNVGDLDLDSFISFIDQLSDAEYTTRSRLRKINISLMSRISQFSQIKTSLIKYFTLWIESLNEIGIFTSMHVSPEQLNPLYQEINYNSIRKYGLNLNKSCEFLHKETPHLFYYEYYVKKSKVAYVINAITSSFIINKKDKIYHKLLSFLVTGKDKELIVTFK